MHSHSRRQLILESGCSHQVAVFPLCQCPLFLHLFLLLQLCMASRQTGQKFFWFIFWLQASLHHQLLNVLISLFKLSQAVQAKQKNACLLAGFCQVFASPVYYIVRWSKSMLYDSSESGFFSVEAVTEPHCNNVTKGNEICRQESIEWFCDF